MFIFVRSDGFSQSQSQIVILVILVISVILKQYLSQIFRITRGITYTRSSYSMRIECGSCIIWGANLNVTQQYSSLHCVSYLWALLKTSFLAYAVYPSTITWQVNLWCNEHSYFPVILRALFNVCALIDTYTTCTTVSIIRSDSPQNQINMFPTVIREEVGKFTDRWHTLGYVSIDVPRPCFVRKV